MKHVVADALHDMYKYAGGQWLTSPLRKQCSQEKAFELHSKIRNNMPFWAGPTDYMRKHSPTGASPSHVTGVDACFVLSITQTRGFRLIQALSLSSSTGL